MLYGALFLIALWLNKDSKENLLLTLVVGFSHLFPMKLITDYYLWYFICFSSEISKIVLSVVLNTKFKLPIVFICLLMCICHCISFYFDGFTKPYKPIMQQLEWFEIFICILFSTPIITKIKGIVQCKIWKFISGYSVRRWVLSHLQALQFGRCSEQKQKISKSK